MGGADGSTAGLATARAADAAAAIDTASATGRFDSCLAPSAGRAPAPAAPAAALVFAFAWEVTPLLLPVCGLLAPPPGLDPRWQVAWWIARFLRGTRWPQSGHVTLGGASESESSLLVAWSYSIPARDVDEVEGEVPGLAAARMAGLAPTPPDERCRVARGDRRMAAAAGDGAGEGGEEAELTPSAGGSFRLLVLVAFIMASVGSGL